MQSVELKDVWKATTAAHQENYMSYPCIHLFCFSLLKTSEYQEFSFWHLHMNVKKERTTTGRQMLIFFYLQRLLLYFLNPCTRSWQKSRHFCSVTLQRWQTAKESAVWVSERKKNKILPRAFGRDRILMWSRMFHRYTCSLLGGKRKHYKGGRYCSVQRGPKTWQSECFSR